MKENSIGEDIETIKYNMKIIKNVMNNFEDELCEKMQMKTDEVNKAIEHILSDYKRVLNENEELKEYNIEYKRILDLADNRIYRKKYLEERRKEQPNLLYPDSDEIYQRYYELKQENEELKEINEELSENKLLQDIEIKKKFIPIQKVKDIMKYMQKKYNKLDEQVDEYINDDNKDLPNITKIKKK